jgi:hypothetical protein
MMHVCQCHDLAASALLLYYSIFDSFFDRLIRAQMTTYIH